MDRHHIVAQAAVIKAMGHPSRLLMLQALAGGPRCVCELAEQVGSDMSTVSRHLAQLRQAGLVSDEREGTRIICHLRVPCVLDFLSCIDRVLDPHHAPALCGTRPQQG